MLVYREKGERYYIDCRRRGEEVRVGFALDRIVETMSFILNELYIMPL